MALQLGSKRVHPDELTSVSDSGKRVQLTTLWRQGRRVYSKALALQLGSKRAHPDELTQVSDSGKRVQLTTL
ncbi:hypothetical protein [Yersinia mollaretii]|uniref:hypothetical protein n=1 Tax=Yersinia mollaretii TaxID=33060 RepID=UPI0011A7812C|nr:hypothetical protein [Yersinia mollaretii]